MTMNRFVLPDGPMQIDGRALLRLIQNTETNGLDLLVRESIQNSLDAAADPEKPVIVTFNTSKNGFAEKIATILPEIKDGLRRRYPGEQSLLEIRDSGTTGLTGAATTAETRSGNWNKLVYQILQPQDRPDAGGAWGIGKTVYFRSGAGLVFYYSRIRTDNGNYEERMAACFTEDPTQADRIMPEISSGIAWWGGEHKTKNDGSLQPNALAEKKQIRVILDTLGVKGYDNNETGTSIIIPFFKSDNLPATHENGATWYGGAEGFIKYAVLRWYAVRLENPVYPDTHKKAALIAEVNGRRVTDQMPPIFNVIRGLYRLAYTNKWEEASIPIEEKDLLSQEVRVNSAFDGSPRAGMLVAAILTPNQLQMTAPNNMKSPHTYILNDTDIDPTQPIMAYLRSPGMVVCWNDAGWNARLPSPENGAYLIAIFIPASTQRLNESLREHTKCSTLEEYLRSVERADHAGWKDAANIPVQIINRARINSQTIINSWLAPSPPATPIGGDHLLGREYGDAILPAGFGSDSRTFHEKRNSSNNSSMKTGANAKLMLSDFKWSSEGITMNWELGWGNKNYTRHILQLNVASELSTISPSQWKEELGTDEFPFSFGHFTITSAGKRKSETANTFKMALPEKKESAGVGGGIISVSPTGYGTEIEIQCRIGENMNSWELKGSLSIKIVSDNESLCPKVTMESHVDNISQTAK